jgi:Fe-S-cluster-containing hydrogenase component 2
VTIGACQGCGACLLTCPEHAIRPAGGTLHVLPGRCTGCLECVEICPVGVISFSESSAIRSSATDNSASYNSATYKAKESPDQ